MSLISLEPAVAATVLDPILYDSGWKRVVGTGSTFEVESLTYTADAVVRVFGRMYKNTTPQEWRLYYDNQDNLNSNFSNWIELSQLDKTPKTGSTNFLDGVDYCLQVGNDTMTNSFPTNPHNASGYSLMAGKQVIFKCQGASSSEGIEYRIIVERSTSAVMLSRSLGKSQ